MSKWLEGFLACEHIVKQELRSKNAPPIEIVLKQRVDDYRYMLESVHVIDVDINNLDFAHGWYDYIRHVKSLIECDMLYILKAD